MYQHNKTKGFTIIELMLAMSFVSILLISVAMLTIQVSHLYTRGLTMKEVNQSGTEIADDIRRSVAASYVEGVELKTVATKKQKILCTGIYTYLANGAEQIERNTATDLIKYPNDTVVRLAKIVDPGGTLCKAVPPATNPVLPAKIPSTFESTELLSGGDRSLVVHDLKVTPSSLNDTEKGLFTIQLTLRTGATAELTNDGRCRAPLDNQSGGEYCAIDTFTIVARAGNTYRK